MEYGFVYITTNIINGKKYIGQKKYIKGWECYLGSGVHLKRAIKIYGKENFKIETLKVAYSKLELDTLEIEFIKEYNAVKDSNYYNISIGGDGGIGLKGRHHSEKTRLEMSIARKGLNTWSKGVKMSKESVNKSRESKIGTHPTKEAMERMSESKIGKNNPWFGKSHTKETKKKMSDYRTKLNKNQVLEVRNKYATGEYTYYKLAEEYPVSYATISNIINHKFQYNKTI